MIIKSAAPQVVIVDQNPSPATFAMRVCNFPTHESSLSWAQEHELAKELIAAIWYYESGWIDLVGYASRLKYRHHPLGNQHLGWARCISVESFIGVILSSIEGNFRFNVIESEGDSRSQKDVDIDDWFHRAVDIRFFGATHTHPHVQPKPNLVNRAQLEKRRREINEQIKKHVAELHRYGQFAAWYGSKRDTLSPENKWLKFVIGLLGHVQGGSPDPGTSAQQVVMDGRARREIEGDMDHEQEAINDLKKQLRDIDKQLGK